MASITIDWNSASTLVREKVIPKIKDQYFKTNALMYRLRDKLETYSGGSYIRQPLSFAPEGGGGQWWAGGDRFNLTAREPFDSAYFYAKNFELPIVIMQDEEDAVDSPESFTNLLSAKMTVAQRTTMDSIGNINGIYNAGTNPKAITGLQFSLSDTISSPYGGIAQSAGANPWWNHQTNATAFATGNASGQGGTYIQALNMQPWDNMIAAQSLAAGKHCTMIVCNWGVFNELKALVSSRTTFFRPQQQTDLAKLGYTNFVYNDIIIVVDEQVPRNSSTKVEKVYFIDERCLHLWVHTKRNWSFSGWREAVDQAVRVAYIWFRGELTFDERRSSGVHSNVTTTNTSP
jgi:hypothetical protein